MGIPGSRDRREAEWWVLPCVPRTFKLYHLRPVGTTGMSNPRYVDIFTHLRLSVAVLGLFKKKFSICVEQQDFKTWVASYLAHCLVRGTQEITANAKFQRTLQLLFVGAVYMCLASGNGSAYVDRTSLAQQEVSTYGSWCALPFNRTISRR